MKTMRHPMATRHVSRGALRVVALALAATVTYAWAAGGVETAAFTAGFIVLAWIVFRLASGVRHARLHRELGGGRGPARSALWNMGDGFQLDLMRLFGGRRRP